ncbi:cupin domain-containing protein [Nocardia farcinica]|uniref:cupin domain-containing protein n=1 Tax=Nocardia farcinica TaxID=37329 RepID=UPI002456B42D|nr:cupin domain-containing protein [Nocardia farcinica]
MSEQRAVTFRNGHRVTLVDRGVDERGPYLKLHHHLLQPGRQAGPHWHPELAESWTVRAGRLWFEVDGTEIVAGPGVTVSAPPRAVHQFRCEEPGTEFDHEIRPPLRHWQMFELWSALDLAGRTTAGRIPRNPLALALLWEYQDGYLAGVPAWAQRVVLGGLARIARRVGYPRPPAEV